jgi:mRNA-degrading endonuclease YafQ of YafQ-DinJ toxin-antitoxin module
MYNVRLTTEFKKDLKRIKKRGYDIDLLSTVFN